MSSYPNGLKSPPIVSDGFGWRIHPLTGARTFHYGVDSHSHPGGLNYAPEAGVVVFAAENYGAGLEVRIDVPGTNRQWRLKHHARFLVAVGQTISEAAPTGVTGTTGDSTGVHCHTDLLIAGTRVDPWIFIQQNLEAASTNPQEEVPDMLFYKDLETSVVYSRDPNAPEGAPQLAILGKSPSGSVGFTVGRLDTAEILPITGPQATKLIAMYGVKRVSPGAYAVWSTNTPAIKGLAK
jgi:murein DD-endopeptidase MepM/ murein hydrolase activator NlpD